MNVLVAAIGPLRGSGYATRIASMVHAYATVGWRVDLLHFRNDREAPPPEDLSVALRDYTPILVPAVSLRDHAALQPPLARLVASNAPAELLARSYDVAQAESSAAWPAVARAAARTRVLVLIDDDSTRFARFARRARDPRRKLLRYATAVKYRRFQRRAMRSADQVWFVSPAELTRMADCDGKAVLVPNAADAAFFAVPPEAGRGGGTVMFVGPARYHANAQAVDGFLRLVWPHVLARVQDASLHLVGDGWASVAAAGTAVIDRGFVDDLPATVAGADVVVAPLLEGGGTKVKVLEAMAAARPVVATPVAAEGIPYSTGLRVVEVGAAMAAEIATLLRDHPLARRAGAANRLAVRELEWSAVWRRAMARLERGDAAAATPTLRQ
jgi:glycosyltransferase involved in cell wall biosynthesis